MYLKRLELQGFKSFADKVQLDFGPGITVIVGPNGSGKSNITDAVRWVLGEQSAKTLRGFKMEDVIFAGSDKRKAVSRAEVSLIFDNSDGMLPLDFNEVAATRRLFRSGESTYLINKTPCRLRDLQDLFLNTGLGKEAFSIIGQGNVTEILNSRPEERRGLIEEAAGVVKYRRRKKEAQRKLEETRNSLERINDLILELQSQLEPLKKQAEKASEYKKLEKELKELELELINYELRMLQEQLEEAAGEVEEWKNALAMRQAQAYQVREAGERARSELQKVDKQVSRLMEEVYELTNETERAEGAVSVTLERIKSLQEKLFRLQAERKELARKLEDLGAKFAQREEEHRHLQDQIAAKEQAVREQETELASLERELKEQESKEKQAKAELFDLLNEISHGRNEFTRQEQQLHGAVQRSLRLEENFKSLKGNKEKIIQKIKELEVRLKACKVDFGNLEGKRRELLRQREEEQQKLVGRQESLNKLKEEARQASSRLQVLQEMENSYEGYQGGVRAVLKACREKSICTGIYGVVAEILRVPTSYERAVEVALGGALQYIVTDTARHARQAIEFLKREKAGRATFLPLEVIKPRVLPPEAQKVLSWSGVLGAAADLVRCEEKFASVVKYLLGGVLVTSNLKVAQKVARALGYNLKVVTLEGDVINPGGSFTGGSYRKSGSSLLARLRQIRQLKEQLKYLNEEIEREEQLTKMQQEKLVQVTEQINQVEEEIREARLVIAGLQRDLEHFRQELEEIKESEGVLEVELEETREEINRLNSGKKELEAKLDQLKVREKNLTEIIDRCREKIENLQSKKEKKIGAITELRIELASLRQEETGLQHFLKDFYQTRDEYEKALARRQKELEDTENRMAEATEERSKLENRLRELKKVKSRKEAELELLRQEREKCAADLQRKEEEIKVAQRQIDEVKEKLHRAEINYARLEAERANREKTIHERFGLTLKEVLTKPSRIDDPDAASKKVERLKKSIKRLGTVNMAALEDYRRLKERYDFLSRQRNDLFQAENYLQQVIQKMDAIMSKRFETTFAAVSQAFCEIFRRLFGGGRAELQLANPENLLETGVEIVAQPPGKKLQHLNLLSGGEKALTVIALLFALLRVKPSPLVILDEIDASLDENNVERFAALLKEFADRTQFIVISHRQGTMEVADALYGVTMQETGVSQLMSVRLGEASSRAS
ncbi:chromosome segregation protein SMC [Calderihabitans maritimus]|uniref:Chromosome partition protein Smc n=1 Tax=Calderihabitans maritimus TaxID=1246530 RepID=A0A1Z5HNU2_9FIRM|nr:chromosome segregation protein SMC [Calderihabitans maritimus]GAW91047.1 chromosome segregation protein SMC [Calderihabitans maritimus]